MTLPNIYGRFVWYELSTTNIEAAKIFYCEVLGWDVQDMSMPGMSYAAFTLGGLPVCGVLGLSQEALAQGGKPHWIGYIDVRDVDATVREVEQHGGRVRAPAADVFGFSRFAIVADPDMATFAIVTRLQPGLDPPIDKNLPGRVGWHELLAGNCEKALNFYETLFGWKREEKRVGSNGAYLLFSANAQTVGGITAKPGTVSVPAWVYYFTVDDIDNVAKRVRNSGGRVIEGPVQIPGESWVLQCVDPQDALFALVGKRKHKAIVRIRRSGSTGSNAEKRT